MQRRSVRQRTLVPLLVLFWRAKGNKSSPVQKAELIKVDVVDLEFQAQMLETRRQLDAYDRSREPEVRGKWNKVCSECGYVNHERHRYCESCGCSMIERAVHHVDHVCPKCGAHVARHDHECRDCGARFWSPITVTRAPEGGDPPGDEKAR